ncbi:MAG TPA: multidrug transporter, partial [Alcanivorax sp.]|nr:multidrug transporter [Alcanivorax sp.]
MNRKALTALFATLAVGGCTLAPDYQQPESPVPATAGDNQRIAEELVLPGWEALFQDPQLQQLIRTALSNNRDLRLALLDVAEARAQYRIEGAALYPELSVDGEGSRQRLPADLSQTGDSEIQTQYSVGLGVAAYEVDLFGRLRSLKQSALQ